MSEDVSPGAVRYPSGLKVWTRLEPLTRNAELTAGLRAEIHDPLWLLGRQWQVGEFRGEDAGSPVDAKVVVDHDAVTGVKLGDEPPIAYDPMNDGPLEAVVERDGVVTGRSPSARQRAEAGQYLLRLLDAGGASVGPADFPQEVRLSAPDEPLDPVDERYIELMAGRALDGQAIAEGIEDGTLPLPTGVDRADFEEATAEFLGWYRTLYDEASERTSPAWDPERFEYRFKVSTGAGTDQTVFSADEYPGGRLDWYAFSAGPDSLDLPDESGEVSTTEPSRDYRTRSEYNRLPTAIDFPGMPAPRWWEFEDASLNLEQLTAAPETPARLALLEFMLVFGNDWFIVPVDTPVGTLSRVTTLEITDTFGVTTGEGDREVPPADGSWNLFMAELPGDDGGPSKGLFVPPVLNEITESEPVELVHLARDEMANLAFAIEERVESSIGTPVDLDAFEPGHLAVVSMRPADDANQETIVLENVGMTEIDAQGWRIQPVSADGPVGAGYALDGITVPPGASVTIVTGTDGAGSADGDRYLEESSALLTEPIQQLIVRRPDDRMVDRVRVPSADRDRLPVYRLATSVPDHWHPLKPMGPDTDRAYRYRIARLLDIEALDVDITDVPVPEGRLLEDSLGVDIYEEEITRAGVELSRSYQLARWLDGSTHLWSGRRTRTGRGEGSSGLRFDILED